MILIVKNWGKKEFSAKIALVLFVVGSLFISQTIFPQASTTNYNFASSANGSLSDMSAGTTTLIGPNVDGLNTGTFSVVNDVGFTFYFMATPYSTFVATEDGDIRLGNSLTSINRVPDIVANEPRLMAFSCDMLVGNNGKVHYKVTGTAPSRVLIVEWKNMIMSYADATGSDGNSTFQLRIYEATGIIEYVYGYMNVITHRTGQEDFGIIGFCSSNTDNTFISLQNSFTLPAVQTVNPFTPVLPVLITTTGEVTGLSSYYDEQRRLYRFTPKNAAPAAPTNLNFSNVTQTSITVNWTDNSSVETNYLVYRSDDNEATYQLFASTSSNAVTSGAITGLPSKIYYWKVYAVNEGLISSALEGSCSTQDAGNKISNKDGNWDDATLWTPNGVPLATDNAIIADGTAVVINTTGAVCNNLTVGQGAGGLLQFEGGTTSSTLTLDGDLSILVNGSFTIKNSTSGTRKLIIGNRIYANSNLTVNGSFNMNVNSNSIADVEFRGQRDGSISGNGAICSFYSITLNKGTSNVAALEINRAISLASPASDGSTLVMSNGTLKISAANTLIPYYGVITLCSNTSKIWLNHSSAILQTVGYATATGPGNVSINGTVQVTSGNLNLGSGASSILVNGTSPNVGTIKIDGSNGIINLDGKILMNNGAYFVMSAGNFYMNPMAGLNLASGNNVFELGDLTYVNFTGGTLTFVNPKNFTGNFDFYIPTAGEVNKNFLGSTIQFGDGTSSSNGSTDGFTFRGPDRYRLSYGTLKINNPSGSNRHVRIQRIDGYQNLMAQSLNIVAGDFWLNGCPLELSGNITNTGRIDASNASDLLIMKGTAMQYITSGTIITPTNNLNLQINNSTGVTLNSPMTVNTITLTLGKLITTSTNLLTLQSGGTVSGGGTSSYIKGPFKIILPAGTTTANYSFPVGAGSYNLVELRTTRTSASGTCEVVAEVFDSDCGGSYSFGDPTYFLSKNRYWVITVPTNPSYFLDAYIRITEAFATLGQYLTRSDTKTGVYSNISDVTTGPSGQTIISSSPVSQSPSGTLGYFTTASNFLTGPVSVGSGQLYTTLTGATNSLFSAINSRGLRGDVVAQITSNLTETGATALNQWNESGGTGWKLTIQPDGTTQRIISGNVSINPMIDINGADNVIINGVSNYLVFRNSTSDAATTGSTFTIREGVNIFTLENCIIENAHSSSSNGSIYLGTGTNTNITFSSNEIRQATSGYTGYAYNALYNNNALNSKITITGNSIYNWAYNGVNFAGNGDTIKIQNNHFYHTYSNLNSETGIIISGGNGIQITGNYIGGQAASCGGSALTCGAFTGIYMNTGTLSSSIQNNYIKNISTSSGGTLNAGIYIKDGLYSIGDITANEISNFTNTSTVDLFGIRIEGTKSGMIKNNLVHDLTANNSSTALLLSSGIGIYSTGTCLASGNQIYNVSSNTQRTDYPCASGILVYSNAGGGNNIVGNTLYSISSANAGAYNTSATGIYFDLSTSSTIAKNKIYNISNASTGASPSVSGIRILSVNSDIEVSNNMIALGNGQSTNTSFSGIFLSQNPSTSCLTNIFYNSVLISGTVTSGSIDSYCMQRSTDMTNYTISIKNNIFINHRNGGTGKHYALGNLGTSVSGGWASKASNYNVFMSDNTATLGLWGSTGCNLAGWRTNSNCDDRSSSASYTAGTSDGANLNIANLFTDAPNGNLNVNVNNMECWYLNGKGIQLSLNSDFNGNPRSTLVTGGSTDIGAHELAPLTDPISAVQSGTIGNGNTTTYSFGGNEMASITWHGSNFPTVDCKYFSGINPPDDAIFTLAGTKSANGYWKIVASGGTIADYTYDITFSYDDNILKSIDDESVMNICKNPYIYPLATSPSMNFWRSYQCTRNTAANTVTASGVIGFSDFTLEQGSGPLSVKLLYFKAIADQKLVNLKWATASEENNNFFTVERSLNLTQWEIMGNTIPGAGNSSQVLNYESTDPEPYGGTSYYRLKQTDFDGKFSCSDIQVVKFNFPDLYTINAFISDKSLVIHNLYGKSKQVNLILVNVSGTFRDEKLVTIEPGYNKFELQIPENGGMYILKMVCGEDVRVLKFLY